MSAVATTAEEILAAEVNPRRRLLGRIAVGAWALALLVYCIRIGIPFDRAGQTLWILGGFVAVAVGRPWRRMVLVLRDWAAFLVILYVYDYSRGAARLLGSTVQVAGPIAWDKALFAGTVPTTWLQQHYYDASRIHWYDTAASLIYITHFVLPWAIAGVLYVRNRTLWFKWARALVTLSFSALIVFMLMPAAPPWYAANIAHLLPPVERISTRGLDPIGLRMANQLVQQGRAVANDVAAIPSLHTAFAVMTALFFFSLVPKRHRWWLRPLLVAYPFAMLAALVYSGEHYVVDGIAGALFAVATFYGLRTFDRYRERGRMAGDEGSQRLEPAAAPADP